MGTLVRTKNVFIAISLVKLIIHIENIVEIKLQEDIPEVLVRPKKSFLWYN